MAARARRVAAVGSSWRDWLLEGVEGGGDMLRRCPAGPSVRALRTGERPEGTWACARPVHLLTAIAHLQLAAGCLRLERSESAALREEVNRHLEGRGWHFHAQAGTSDWQLECADAIDCTSVEPELAAGRSVRGLMPGGRDGTRVCALMNEIQMLLHEHPVNRERAARGAASDQFPLALGIRPARRGAGGGPAEAVTDDAWLAGVWRLHGGTSAMPGESWPDLPADLGGALVAWARMPDGRRGDGPRAGGAPDVRAGPHGAVSGAIRRVDVHLGARVSATTRAARFAVLAAPAPAARAIA